MDRNEREFKARNERAFKARNEREFKADEVKRNVKADRLEGTEGNAPRTTERGMTSPKFGSAGSGGAEFEGPLPKN